jgi:NAD(P)-dependent dehydrogenase (short-subunit alcohol dehydrogenase family)
MQIDLHGQVAIVTGGGRGIGRAMAFALAESGAAVAVVARSPDQIEETVSAIRRNGGCALALPVDVTDEAAVEGMVAAVEQQLGPVDLLVNNAAFLGQAGPIWEVDSEIWWRVMDVNLRGCFLCSRAVLPGMTARRRGRIVNVSSGASNNPWRYMSSYAISKAALNRFSEILALETADYQVAVFAMNPGLVRTAMTDQTFSPEWQKWDDLIPRLMDKGSDIPPERAAHLLLRLAAGEADSLSGRMINIHEDLDKMIAQLALIQAENLYVLRLSSLPT